MSALIGVSMYRADSLMMIGGGGAIILITLLGCIGAYKQHKCMFGMVSLYWIHLKIWTFSPILCQRDFLST